LCRWWVGAAPGGVRPRNGAESVAHHTLRRAAKDTPYQEVIHQDRLLKVAGFPVFLLVLGGGAVVLVLAVVFGLLRWRRRGLLHAVESR
jgi:hypothetical protein